jgi:hypothetical protein
MVIFKDGNFREEQLKAVSWTIYAMEPLILKSPEFVQNKLEIGTYETIAQEISALGVCEFCMLLQVENNVMVMISAYHTILRQQELRNPGWSKAGVDKLIGLVDAGYGIGEISRIMEKSPQAVAHSMSQFGLKVRPDTVSRLRAEAGRKAKGVPKRRKATDKGDLV